MQITLRFGRRPLTIIRAPVQVRFDVEKGWLDALRERLGGVDNVQIARLGLTVLKWAVDEIQDGRSIYSAGSQTDKTPHRLVLPPVTESKVTNVDAEAPAADATTGASLSNVDSEIREFVRKARARAAREEAFEQSAERAETARAREEEEIEQRAERAGEIVRRAREEEEL